MIEIMSVLTARFTLAEPIADNYFLREVSYPVLMLSFEPAARNFVTKIIVATHSEYFVTLACTVLIGLQSVTYGQTDGRERTDASTIVKTKIIERAKLARYARSISRVKTREVCTL